MKKAEEDVRLLELCEAKSWECDDGVQNVYEKPWTHEELKKLEEALPRLKECDLERASRLYKAKS